MILFMGEYTSIDPRYHQPALQPLSRCWVADPPTWPSIEKFHLGTFAGQTVPGCAVSPAASSASAIFKTQSIQNDLISNMSILSSKTTCPSAKSNRCPSTTTMVLPIPDPHMIWQSALVHICIIWTIQLQNLYLNSCC